MPLPTLFVKGSLQSPTGDPAEQKLLDEWVPMEYIIDWIKSRRHAAGVSNRLLLLKSETASAKSTGLPPELYKSFVMNQGVPGIICTQPRIITAIENVMDIIKNYSNYLRLGRTIGWSTQRNKLPPQEPGLLSATIGTLTQQLRVLSDEELIDKYSFIMIDEVHERDLQTDMAIYMLKNFLLRNSKNAKCPFVILMSATFDPANYMRYFDVKDYIWCKGHSWGIDEVWDWNGDRTVNDYPRTAVDIVGRIIGENPNDPPESADILIFMPGANEFKSTMHWLDELNRKYAETDARLIFSPLQINRDAVQDKNRDYVWTLYTPVAEQEVTINGTKYVPARRVIIATNVAETGLTLSNLKYVIDSGYNREVEYNPIIGLHSLLTKPAPVSRIRQRRGRVGRKFPGKFYPLYPKYIFERLPVNQLANILVNDINEIALQIVSEQIRAKELRRETDVDFNIADIDMLDVPSPDAIHECLEKMYTLGFLSPVEGDRTDRFRLTELGELGAKFSLKLENVRMILAAYSWGVAPLDIVTIAAYLVAGSPQSGKKAIDWDAVYRQSIKFFNETHAYKLRLLIGDDFIDGLVLFNSVKSLMTSNAKESMIKLMSWCADVNISYRFILDYINIRDEIIELMLMEGMVLFSDELALINTPAEEFMNAVTRIKYCIYDGYRNNVLINDAGIYRTISGTVVSKPKLFRMKDGDDERYEFLERVAPTYLLYGELSLKQNAKTNTFEISPRYICALDGFVNIDFDFAI